MIRAQNPKLLRKYLKQLDKRREAFEKTVMKDITEGTIAEIVKRAPTVPELNGYENFLQSAEVLSQPSTAIVYTGPTIINFDKVDAAVTLVYVRDVRKDTDGNRKIFDILKLYQPFSTKTFPGGIEAKDFILTYSKTSQKEVLKAEQRNRDTAPDMAKDLKPLGVKVETIQYEKTKDMQLFPDLTFQVLQHELKTKKKAKPHWRPALKQTEKASFLKKIMNKEATVRILADPNFNGFSLSGKMGLKVTTQSVQSLAEFMRYLEGNQS
jgi:hypothetical protein